MLPSSGRPGDADRGRRADRGSQAGRFIRRFGLVFGFDQFGVGDIAAGAPHRAALGSRTAPRAIRLADGRDGGQDGLR